MAEHCWFDWDVRTIAGDDAHLFLNAFTTGVESNIVESARLRHPAVRTSSTITADVPGLTSEPDGTAETLALRLTGDRKPEAVSYVTEAGLYQEAGHSTVVIGPGSIEQAHRANEFISLDQLRRCQEFLDRLGNALFTP